MQSVQYDRNYPLYITHANFKTLWVTLVSLLVNISQAIKIILGETFSVELATVLSIIIYYQELVI